MALTPGTSVGAYEIEVQIGAGGMGEVYRAIDTNLKRAVAIKVLPQSVAADAERIARFQREAEVLASLNHSNIAAIYGLERSSTTTALVMELVDGPTLADRVAQGPMAVDEALPIANQIADALEAAHDQGIVHRDLKPANIKVRPDGTVKVLDFGLAKAFEPAAVSTVVSQAATITTPAMTQAGLILGTAAYMSPEQARGKTVDTRTDVWAFGCVLFEMLTATRAFDAEDVSLTLSMVLQREPDFSALPSTVPAHFTQTLRACLQKDPRRRLRDMHDVRLAMTGAFQTDTAVVSPSTTAVSHRPRLAWAALGIVLLLAAVSSYGWWRATRPVERPLTRLSVDLGPDAVRAPRDSIALSPDGTRLVFVGRGTESGTRQLFTRRLDQVEATAIPGTVFGNSLSMPFFSPAGDWIAFVAGNTIRKVSIQGGSTLEVAQVPPTVVGASWGDDGDIVIGSSGRPGLLRVRSSDGAVEIMKKSEGVKFFPHVLPGGRAVLYGVSTLGLLGSLEDLRIDVIVVETGETKTLVSGGYAPRYLPTSESTGHLVFIRQGTLFGVPFDPKRLEVRGTPAPLLNGVGSTSLLDGGAQFAFSTNGTFVYLDRATGANAYPISWLNSSGQMAPLIAQPNVYVAPRLSPDGSRLAYTAAGGKGGDVWVYDLRRNTPTQLTFRGPGLNELAWALDSKHLVFGDGESLWWIRADGSGEPQRILEKAANPRPASFSPDGRLVYSRFGIQGLPDLWTLPLDLRDPEHPKPGKPEPFLSEPLVEVDPAFSPDGKFVAYSSNELGPNEVFVHSFPGPAGKWKVSTAGGKFPAWSRTTQELFFLGGDDRIMVANYSLDGGSFAAGTPRPWAATQVLRDGVRQNFDVAPDGKRVVVFPRPTETRPEGSLHATFLLNFFDEIRRRVP
jgi:Tol biopolymer transport system component